MELGKWNRPDGHRRHEDGL